MKLNRYISPRYLNSQRALHQRPKGYGGGGGKWADAVNGIRLEHGCETILDYGCGRGKLITALKERGVTASLFEYDPAIAGKDFVPKHETFDLVTCTDVLEHIEPDKLGVVIDHLFRLANKVLFCVVATRPSKKFFPDGRNVHLLIEPRSWWMERLVHPAFLELPAPGSPLDQPSREFVVLFKRRA